MLKKYFPLSFSRSGLVGLIVTILIYLVAGAVITWVISLFSGVAVIGLIARILSWIIDVYCFAGIIIALLAFFGMLK